MIRKRSSLKMPMEASVLAPATLSAVLRLAEFLDIDTTPKPGEKESVFRRRITREILRWEKRYRAGVQDPSGRGSPRDR